jgi:rhodanese-related sulfurtransferase
MILKFIQNLFGHTTDFKKLVDNGALIVDVRTTAEYQSGHIKGSINIPVDQIKSKVEQLKAKNKPVITCCKSGARSGMAKSILKAQGIEVYNGGGWNVLQQKLA